MAADMNNIENGVDRAQGDVMILRGLVAALPASDPLLIGRLYFATDTSELFRDNGAGWDQIIFDHGDLAGLADNDHPQYIQDIEFAALGDVLVGTGAGTFGNLGIGAGGEVLTVAGGTATWAAAAGGGAWTLIAETILGAPAATVTFAAIPGTYRNLALFTHARTTRAAPSDEINIRCNGDAGGNYAWSDEGFHTAGDSHNGANLGATAATMASCDAANSLANSFGGGLIYFWRYASTTTLKHMRSDSGRGAGWVPMYGFQNLGGWDSTAAITSITLLPGTGPNFDTGCIFTLYGIT